MKNAFTDVYHNINIATEQIHQKFLIPILISCFVGFLTQSSEGLNIRRHIKLNHDNMRHYHLPLVCKVSWVLAENFIYGLVDVTMDSKRKLPFVGRNRNVVTPDTLQLSIYLYRLKSGMGKWEQKLWINAYFGLLRRASNYENCKEKKWANHITKMMWKYD